MNNISKAIASLCIFVLVGAGAFIVTDFTANVIWGDSYSDVYVYLSSFAALVIGTSAGLMRWHSK